MTGSLNRGDRPSPEEGPSIYKFDQLRRMLEKASANRAKRHAGTDPVKFLGGYLEVRTESNGTAKSRRDDDEKHASARFHSYCKQLAKALGLTKEFVMERITEGLLQDESQLKDLCDHLTAASEHYELAMSLIKDQQKNRPVTIRIGTTNLINMRMLPAVLEVVRQEFKKEFPETQLRFTQMILDSDELLFGSPPLVGVDVVVACCQGARAEKIPKSELAASLPLRCCVLRKRSSVISERVESRCLTSWDSLCGTDMVALGSRRKHFDVPWQEIESMVASIEEVPTLLEAHARVAASDAWTFSYCELMDDEDEQHLEALDLPSNVGGQEPLIVAVLPKAKRITSRATSDSECGTGIEKRRALEILKNCLKIAFQQKQDIKSEAEEMTRWLSRFPYSYHVSDYAAKGSSEIQRTWFAGRASLEVTPNGNLSGVFTMGERALKVRVFGRPIPHHNRTVWHLQWRGIDHRAESGTTNLVVTKSDLKEGRELVGSWVGRSSWTADDVRPSGGPFILHTRPNLSTKELKQLVKLHQDQCVPDLRRLSDAMISVGHSDFNLM